MSQSPMEKHLEAFGLTDEAIFSLLWLSEEFGSVTLNHYEDMKDDWGGDRSLTLQTNKKDGVTTEWVVVVKNHPYY